MEAKNFLTARERKEKNLYRESDKKFRCEFCEIFFSRNRDCIRHEKTYHKIRRVFSCTECDDLFYSYEDVLQHSQKHVESSLSFKLHKSAFKGASEIFRKQFESSEGDPINILFSPPLHKEICNIMKHQVLKRKRMSCAFTVHACFLKFNERGDVEDKISFVANAGSSKFSFSDTKTHFLTNVREKMKTLEERLLDFSENGSGWTISELTFLDLTFSTLGGLRGGCHLQIKSVNGLLNIISDDEKCVVYAILAHFFRKTLAGKDKKNSKSYLPYLSHLNLEGIEFPIEPHRLEEIENRKHGVKPFKINVFIQEGEEVYPYRLADTVSEDEKIEEVIRINLLLVEGKDMTTGKKIYHYVYIESLDRFLRKKYRNSSFSKTINCQTCFASFRSENRKDEHEKWCSNGRKTLVYFEKDEQKKIKYLKQSNDSPHILCGFVDFESVLKKENGFEKTVCEDCEKFEILECNHSFTRQIHEHKAINYTFLVVDRDYKVVYQKIYTGEDSVQNFIQTLINKEDFFREILTRFQEMDFTEDDRISFENCDFCYLCSDDFSAESVKQKGHKVRDHCHITGRYISAAHNLCNLSRREKVCIRIYAHNFSGYDSHLIISHLNNEDIEDIQVIPKSGEKFMALFLNNFYGLLDSKSFLSGSLDALIKTLPKNHDFKILRQAKFVKKKIRNEEDFLLLFEKWKFPYEYAQDLSDLENCKTFPSKKDFFNSLRQDQLTEEEYEKSKSIFNFFEFRNLKEYMEIYCLLDTFLLAEVFMLFRKQNLMNFGIEPNNYVSLPGLGLDCFLKKSKIELDFIHSGEMYEMLSSNLRGGMSFTSQRYAESAVFEDMMGVQRSVDEDGRFNLIQYIDANALYASCQTFPLPYTGFKFLSDEEISKIDWATIDLMQDIGYFVEVSLLYPKNIWEKTKSYPLCPQNLEITHDMLSPYQKDVLLKLYNKKTYKQKKLTATFETREKIVLHALNLQQYLKFGMKLLKIFRVIEFKQKPYMTPWIDFCTKKRTESKNDFEKKFWKDYVNSLFGKTIEGVANRKKVIICTSPEKFKKNLSNPNYERHIIVNEEIAIVIKSIEKAKVRRPYYIGFSVLEISKYIMYNFFYEILQPYFGIDGCAVLYQDTDSFVLNLKTKDIISDLKTLSVNMDFSNLHENHPLFSMKNKTQLFKFKEEFALKPISRFCALKSKCYSFELACEHKEGINKEGVCFRCNNTPKNKNTSHYNRLKGVQQSTARQIHFEKYVKCISSVYCRRDHVRQITSKAQKITTNFLNKISISSFDDKRYLLNCGIHSEPYHQKNKPYCLFCKM